MELEIYNQSLENVGIVDLTNSIIWHRKFFESGVFEIVAPANKSNLLLLQKGYVISYDGTDEFGIIDTINITQSEGITNIKATGYIGKGLLSRRIIGTQTTLTDTAENATRQLVTSNVITPTNANRAISNVILGTVKGYTDTVDCVANGDNLLDYIVAISQSVNIGFELFFDKVNKNFYAECRKGTDRSTEQIENPQVIFSQEYDNLRSCDYLCSDVGKANCVKAQYSPSITGIYGDELTGLDRFEGLIEETTGVTTPVWDGENFVDILDINATKIALADKAKQAIIPQTENFEGEVDITQGYKTDYDLGDIVTIENFGYTVSPRIYEVQEVYDENGYTVVPVFGSPAVTMNDILKRS